MRHFCKPVDPVTAKDWWTAFVIGLVVGVVLTYLAGRAGWVPF